MLYDLIRELMAILIGFITIAVFVGLVDEGTAITPTGPASRPRVPSRRVMARRYMPTEYDRRHGRRTTKNN